MSRINGIIASMPPGEAAAVIHLREVHACLMDIDRNHARTLAARAVYLDYLEGEVDSSVRFRGATKESLLKVKR